MRDTLGGTYGLVVEERIVDDLNDELEDGDIVRGRVVTAQLAHHCHHQRDERLSEVFPIKEVYGKNVRRVEILFLLRNFILVLLKIWYTVNTAEEAENDAKAFLHLRAGQFKLGSSPCLK